MTLKGWVQVIGISALMLLTMWLVMYGAWALVVDTGRAIVR